jgi:hypothetical protein
MLATMRWQLTKVRVADIRPEIRHELERAGETVIANALAVPLDVESSPFHKFRHEERSAAEAWLIERRDIAERRERRAERWIGIGSLAAIVAAVAAVLLLIWQNDRWNSEDRPELPAVRFAIPQLWIGISGISLIVAGITPLTL